MYYPHPPSESKHHPKIIIGVVVVFAVAVPMGILLMFLRCWKRKEDSHRREIPPSAMPKEREIQNGQHNNPAPPSPPKNSSELRSYLSKEIHPSSTITGGGGDSHFAYPVFPPPRLQFHTAPTASLLETIVLTSAGATEDGFSNEPSSPDEARAKPLPPALETGSTEIPINQLQTPNSNSMTFSGPYHTASGVELEPPSSDTTSTFATTTDTNIEVLSDKGHVNDIERKTKPVRSCILPEFPWKPQNSRAPLVRDNGVAGSSHVRPNRARSDNQMLSVASPSDMALKFARVTLFSYEELAEATDQFSSANLLGQGGFGFVHKGILANGDQVAIKQLKIDSGQGDREFKAEVEIISRVHHKHLVSLVGYCMTEERRVLVYEFVPNNSLKFHLHGDGRPTMEWSTRVKIALGSAKGLAYLHEDCHPKIIHRDIKSDNILLDLNCEAKIADFGLAKIFPDDNTHIEVTRVMGTFGYMDPGCFYSHKFTEKSDVFSFGVMILELLTGRRAITRTQSSSVYSLVEWARPLMETRDYNMLVDPRLQGNYDTNEMERVVACAAACVRPSARSRPIMSQIVRALEGHLPLNNLNMGIAVSRASTMGSISKASTLESFGV